MRVIGLPFSRPVACQQPGSGARVGSAVVLARGGTGRHRRYPDQHLHRGAHRGSLLGSRVATNRGAEIDPHLLAPRDQSRGALAVEVGLLCVLAAFAFRLIGLLSVVPVSSWDGWAIWAARPEPCTPRATFGALPSRIRPLLPPTPRVSDPLPDARGLSLDAIGRYDAAMLHVVPGVLFVAVALAVWALLRLAIAPWLAALSAVAILGVEPLVENLRHNYADSETAPCGVARPALPHTLARARLEARCSCRPACFWPPAALLKNEGLMFALVAVAAAAVACPLARRSPRALLAGRRCGARRVRALAGLHPRERTALIE